MIIYLGSDHGGFELKEKIQDYLKEKDVTHLDMGCFRKESVDYPDIAETVCKEVLKKDDAFGILVCGTGIGMSISANKIHGIRAALCHNEYEARMAREHNHANVLCLGGRVTGDELAVLIVETFLDSEESGDRHQRRVDKIMKLEC
jgi:ribose 5-phosphate isomerase B